MDTCYFVLLLLAKALLLDIRGDATRPEESLILSLAVMATHT